MIEFNTLPQDIKDWISSDQITMLIRNLENGLSIEGSNIGIVADTVYDIATKTLLPQNIKDVLKKAGLSDEQTNTILRELRDQILAPIKISLRGNLNIDIELIAGPGIGARSSAGPIPTVVNLRNQAPRSPSGMEIKPQPVNNEPFILHRENPDLRPFIQNPSKPTITPTETKPIESERIVHYSGPTTNIANGKEQSANG